MTSNDDRDPADAPAAEQRDEDVSFLGLAIVLAKHKWLVLGLPLAAAVVTAVYALFLTPIYTASTKILPPQQNQTSALALVGQLGALTGLAGGLGAKGANELYIAMLKSRTVADAMIERFDLRKLYGTDGMEATRTALAGKTLVAASKEGIISISVDDPDPKRAAMLANAYVDELYKLNATLAVTEASQRRLFFERQLAQVRDNLAKAEGLAKQAIDKGGVAQVETFGRTMIETTARLRAQLSVKEIQIGAMRTFATENHPEYTLALKELDAIRRELAKLEGGRNDAGEEASGRGMENFRLLRNVKYYETMFELLAKQYEIARIEEAKDASLIQVLDKAIEPEMRSKPRRAQMVLLAALAAAVVAAGIAFVIEAMRNAASQPGQSQRLQTLLSYLRTR